MIMFIALTALAIHCWDCSSHINPGCGDPFYNNSFAMVDCDQQVRPHLQEQATFCRKIVQKGKSLNDTPKNPRNLCMKEVVTYGFRDSLKELLWRQSALEFQFVCRILDSCIKPCCFLSLLFEWISGRRCSSKSDPRLWLDSRWVRQQGLYQEIRNLFGDCRVLFLWLRRMQCSLLYYDCRESSRTCSQAILGTPILVLLPPKTTHVNLPTSLEGHAFKENGSRWWQL